MRLGGLIRSTGFCLSESFVCSVYPAFNRRGAHPAWSLAACFSPGTPEALRAWIALPKAVESTRHRFPTR